MRACTLVVLLGAACTYHHASTDVRLAGYPEGHRMPYRIAVVAFTDATAGAGTHDHGGGAPVPHAHGELFAEAFGAALLELPGHVVLMRRDAAKLVEQAAMAQAVGAQQRDPAAAADVDGLVLGTVSAFEQDQVAGLVVGSVHASARLVDLRTGAAVWAVSAQVAGHGTVEQVAARAAGRMVAQLRERIGDHGQ